MIKISKLTGVLQKSAKTKRWKIDENQNDEKPMKSRFGVRGVTQNQPNKKTRAMKKRWILMKNIWGYFRGPLLAKTCKLCWFCNFFNKIYEIERKTPKLRKIPWLVQKVRKGDQTTTKPMKINENDRFHRKSMKIQWKTNESWYILQKHNENYENLWKL